MNPSDHPPSTGEERRPSSPLQDGQRAPVEGHDAAAATAAAGNVNDGFNNTLLRNPGDEEESAGPQRVISGEPLRHAVSAPLTPTQYRRRSSQLSSTSSRAARVARRRRSSAASESVTYDAPDSYANLDEVMDVSPIQNANEDSLYRRDECLEETRSRRSQQPPPQPEPEPELEPKTMTPPITVRVSRLATQLYTISYLVLFSILGTLARLGLQALTTYPGTPVIFTSLWPNFAGSLVMGFLAEDRMLFLQAQQNQSKVLAGNGNGDEESSGSGAEAEVMTVNKKTIPLYIGLATGFCGSFTSFSAFIRDIFLALSNDLPSGDVARNGGYSFVALLGVLIVTVSLSLSGLFMGAHLAIALEPYIPSLPYPLTRRFLDRMGVVLGWGCWVGAVILSIVPPDRNRTTQETEGWRGAAMFALVFAPLGCLLRFYASLYLNSRVASFPLGTFTVNMLGTAVLGMAWDLQHVPLGGAVGCQVLQGIEDGFCGCLTTVSTWVAELSALRRRHAYTYGGASVLGGLALMVAIMGGLRWSSSQGFADPVCIHAL
ncbi:CrcB-like protein-domain-containing protein [Diplogelasinospora grovesii]|uniref:CrcB-like protein-domain-containing protein n=1 Tax=Diplogelasinospora grovesii TaxID=303347 RepID=A0AAN6N7N8_9PEZI|nr:CrcB-like protein-domain-containing protein [Diplogelasinospora grovesii]